MVVISIKCHGCNKQLHIDASVLLRRGKQIHFCSKACNARFVTEQGAKQVEANYEEEERARRHRAMLEERASGAS